MRTTLIITICLLSLFALGVSCSEDSKDCSSTEEQIQKPLNPNGDSELALLMRAMFDEAQRIKKQIANNEPVTLTLDHDKILTAHATEPEKAASEEYKAFAAAYLQTIESLETASQAQIIDVYDGMINNCMTCHKALCPGPMARIKNLQQVFQPTILPPTRLFQRRKSITFTSRQLLDQQPNFIMTNNHTIEIEGHRHVSFHLDRMEPAEMAAKSDAFYQWLDTRRSVREFTNEPVAKSVIENIIKSASTAPSGAHKQPWTFCAISDPVLKKQIRIAAEAEEKESYESRMSDRWKDDLKPMATNMYKPFLEEAPWLIIVCKRAFELDADGKKHNNYYVNESVGIACGMLITAIHNAGLVTLTHTPSPMNFLTNILKRPKNERAYLLLPVGYPKQPVYVPDLERKGLDEMAVFYEGE